jgi:hypothetical protein
VRLFNPNDAVKLSMGKGYRKILNQLKEDRGVSTKNSYEVFSVDGGTRINVYNRCDKRGARELLDHHIYPENPEKLFKREYLYEIEYGTDYWYQRNRFPLLADYEPWPMYDIGVPDSERRSWLKGFAKAVHEDNLQLVEEMCGPESIYHEWVHDHKFAKCLMLEGGPKVCKWIWKAGDFDRTEDMKEILLEMVASNKEAADLMYPEIVRHV